MGFASEFEGASYTMFLYALFIIVKIISVMFFMHDILPLIVSQLINGSQGPTGQQWKVELVSINNKVEFRHGWQEFVSYIAMFY